MADPSAGMAKPMAWWGTIQAAVGERASTAEVWSAIQARSAELGLATPPGMFQAVNEIRAQAAELRNASSRLAAADPAEAITGRFLAPLPYGAIGPAAGPRLFDVRVNYTAVGPTGEVSDYITLRYTGGLPPTVGELRDEAQLATESLVEGYGRSFTGLGAIEIGEL
jgi:hypothetical protein